jgi:aldose 1-epimerase
VPASRFWELRETLPTGKVLPVEGDCDLRQGKALGQLVLDHVLTGVLDGERQADGLVYRGSVQREGGLEVRMFASPEFREVVVFTPPHRQAVCIEPYTCVTDAINLQQRGSDAGLRVLQPGESWHSVVETRVEEVA